MLVLLPVHPTTPNLDTLVKDIQRKGKLENHVLRLVSRKEDEGLAFTIGEQLADTFLKVTTQSLPERKRNAIELGNDLFRAAYDFVRDYKSGPNEFPDHPLLFLSPNYRPSCGNWLDSLQAEFFLKQATVLGRTTTGPQPKSRLLTGPVVFGKKFTESNPEMLDLLEPTTIWRERLVWQLMKGSVETKLIGSGSKSVLRKIPDAK